MIRIIQDFLLSDFLLYIILFIVFSGTSFWALQRLREYVGYALGVMVALLFMIIYSSLGIKPITTDIEAKLTIFQVMCPAIVGLFIGGLTLFLLRFVQGFRGARTSMMVAFFTTLNISLIFLMFVQGPIAKRMIGIFALAFAIAALFALAILQGQTRAKTGYSSQSASGRMTEDALTPDEPPAMGSSRLDDIRRRMQENNNNQQF